MLLIDIFLNIYYLLIGFLVLAFLFFVLPYMVQLVLEELSIFWKQTKPPIKEKTFKRCGRHTLGMGRNHRIVEDLVVTFRDGRENIVRHRRLAT